MEACGLVLEGGGMRGVYTAGVLEYFLEQGLYFPYVIGVSAGACNAASYLSRQAGRNKKVTIGYIRDPRYLSYRNLLREKSLFGMDFIFDHIPNQLEPFDFPSFYGAKEEFVVGTTDAFTGEPVYFAKRADLDMLKVIRASSSLPFVAKPVELDGRILFDGGLSDPVPLLKSMTDGNRRNVVILTKAQGHRKSPFRFKRLASRFYPQYDGLIRSLTDRPQLYNATMDELERQERDGDVFVFRPSVDLKVSRTEKKAERLSALHDLGYADAKRQHHKLQEWMGGN
jgi:predicted patatin/cPLA2 family phospholipase